MYETRTLSGSADGLANHLDNVITESISASIEAQDELCTGDARLILRTYERYSVSGGNRLTLNVAILAVGSDLKVALTTSGGSRAVFFKVNTIGEETFMESALAAVDSFAEV